MGNIEAGLDVSGIIGNNSASTYIKTLANGLILANTAGSTLAFLGAGASVIKDTIAASLTVNGDTYVQNGSAIYGNVAFAGTVGFNNGIALERSSIVNQWPTSRSTS